MEEEQKQIQQTMAIQYQELAEQVRRKEQRNQELQECMQVRETQLQLTKMRLEEVENQMNLQIIQRSHEIPVPGSTPLNTNDNKGTEGPRYAEPLMHYGTMGIKHDEIRQKSNFEQTREPNRSQLPQGQPRIMSHTMPSTSINHGLWPVTSAVRNANENGQYRSNEKHEQSSLPKVQGEQQLAKPMFRTQNSTEQRNQLSRPREILNVWRLQTQNTRPKCPRADPYIISACGDALSNPGGPCHGLWKPPALKSRP